MTETVICYDIHGQPHQARLDELVWRPSVYGVLIKDGHVLMAKQFGKYGLPGGGMDFGEKPEQTLVREFAEETGLRIKGLELQSVQSDLFKPPHVETGGFMQSVQLFYRCAYEGGELSVEGFDDHEQQYAEMAEWLPVDSIETVQTYGTPDFIGEVKKALQAVG